MLDKQFSVGIITLSDKGFQGKRKDVSGDTIVEIASQHGMIVKERILLPDEKSALSAELIRMSQNVNLILTTGGSGFSKRDVTPEATLDVIEKRCDGVIYAIVANGLNYTPRAMLSRAVCGIRGECVILNLPGSPKAVKENLEFILPSLLHGIDVLLGAGECAR